MGFGGTLRELLLRTTLLRSTFYCLFITTNQLLFLSPRLQQLEEDTRWNSCTRCTRLHATRLHREIRGHDIKPSFWPTIYLLHTVILIQEQGSRPRTQARHHRVLSEGWLPYLYPMKFVSFYEVRVSSWSLLHFEDSIGVVDQILDKDRRECTSTENCIRLWRILGNSKLAHGWLPYISLYAKLDCHHLLEPVLISLSIVSQCVPCRRELKFPCPTIIIISVI